MECNIYRNVRVAYCPHETRRWGLFTPESPAIVVSFRLGLPHEPRSFVAIV